MVLSVAVVIATVLVLVGPAMAATILVGNSSFESNVVADGAEYGYGGQFTSPASGWQLCYGNNTAETYNPASADFAGADGNGNLPSPALGSQALFNAATSDNDVLMLTRPSGTVKTVMHLDAGEWFTYTVAVGQGLSLHGAPWYGGFSLEVADMTAGGNLFIPQEFHAVGTMGANLQPGQIDTPAPGTFQDFGVVFPADKYIDNDIFNDGDALRVGFVFGMATYMDNVRVSEWSSEADAIAAEAPGGIYINENPSIQPEPSTLVLLASGLIGLLAYAWRKRRHAA